MARGRGGFIGQDGLNAPDSPTGVSATGGNAQATVSFTAPTDVGGSAITGYRAQSNTGVGASGSSSPITVTGLSNGTSYTFNVWAINAFGYSAPSDASGAVTPVAPQYGLFCGGYYNPGSGNIRTNIIDYINLLSAGNASDWGDLTQGMIEGANGNVGSSTRAIIFSGERQSDESKTNVIQYISLASTGNANDFGDLSGTPTKSAAVGSSTRGICCAGDSTNVIQYITIASTGNATDFGDTTQNAENMAGVSSPTRGVFGSVNNGNGNRIEYITIASTGNATFFGAFGANTGSMASGSSATRGIFAGVASSSTDTIEYVTIASTGNANDFGNLTQSCECTGGVTGSTKMGIALCVLGSTGAVTNIIDQVTIASTGNATDFGDLTVARRLINGGASSVHGGIS